MDVALIAGLSLVGLVLIVFIGFCAYLLLSRASVRSNELQRAVGSNYVVATLEPVGVANTEVVGKKMAFVVGPGGSSVMVPLEEPRVPLTVLNRTGASMPTPYSNSVQTLLVPRRSSRKVQFVSNQNSNTDEESNNGPFSSSSSSKRSRKAKRARRARKARQQ